MRILFFPLFLLGLACSGLQAQGIEFFHGTWSEALEKAKSTEKLIFIDAYAQWCGPCKMMAATAFKDEAVGKYFNENFVNLKIDWESAEAVDLKKIISVTAYPSLFFMKANGELIQKSPGGRDAAGLLTLAKSIAGKNDTSKDFEAEYQKGNRDPKLVCNYIKALNKSGKPSQKVVNDYIAKQKDFTTEDNLKIIYEGTTEADSKAFDLFTKYKEEIKKLFGEEKVQRKIELACHKTVQKAIQFQNKDLLTEAQQKMRLSNPMKSDSFATASILDYCKAVGDSDGYCKACKELIKDERKETPAKLHAVATEIFQNFSKDKAAMKLAETYAEKAAKKTEIIEYLYTYASIQLLNGHKKDAMKTAMKAKELSEKKGLPSNQIDILITKIRESNS